MMFPLEKWSNEQPNQRFQSSTDVTHFPIIYMKNTQKKSNMTMG